MYRLLVILAFVFCLNTHNGFAQTVGDQEETILRVLGRPSVARETGDRKIWMYPDGTKVVLEGGVVVESTAPSSGPTNAPRRQELESERSGSARAASSTRAGRTGRPPSSAGLGLLLIVVAGLVLLVCNLLFIIAAFSESVLWGLGVLFVPFVSLVFLVLHWSEVKKPFLISLLVGAPLLGVGLALQS